MGVYDLYDLYLYSFDPSLDRRKEVFESGVFFCVQLVPSVRRHRRLHVASLVVWGLLWLRWVERGVAERAVHPVLDLRKEHGVLARLAALPLGVANDSAAGDADLPVLRGVLLHRRHARAPLALARAR